MCRRLPVDAPPPPAPQTCTCAQPPACILVKQDHDVQKQRLDRLGRAVKEAEKHDVAATKAPPPPSRACALCI